MPPGLPGSAGDDGDAGLPLIPEQPGCTLLPTVGDMRRAVREAFALSVEDVLARRSRVLFLDAALAAAAAPAVARIMARELGWSPARGAAGSLPSVRSPRAIARAATPSPPTRLRVIARLTSPLWLAAGCA